MVQLRINLPFGDGRYIYGDLGHGLLLGLPHYTTLYGATIFKALRSQFFSDFLFGVLHLGPQGSSCRYPNDP